MSALLVIYFTACSSSTYTDRYNKPKERETPSRDNSIRFSSENNNEPDTVLVKPSYNLPEQENTEFDEIPVDDATVNTSEIIGKYKNLDKLGPALNPRERILLEVVKYLETPYKYGGNDFNGIDCSAFTQNVFSRSINLSLPRTASEQFREGEKLSRNEDLKFGDLVFFNTTKRSYPGHVGVYLGQDLFAHASLSQGVIVSSLQSSYYKTRYVGARRVVDNVE